MTIGPDGKVDREPQRYQICGDDSGHDYFVPVEKVDLFYKWVSSFEDGVLGKRYKGLNFDGSRIDGRFTFTDPRCD